MNRMNRSIESLKAKHQNATQAEIGSLIKCPSCGRKHIKKVSSHVFCCKHCKDHYWNNIDENKRCNVTRISPANARWQSKRADFRLRETPNEFLSRNMHPFEEDNFSNTDFG